MEIDDIDVRLIKLFYELKPKETTNTYILTQKIYPNKKSYDIVRKYPLIKNRLKKLNNYGLIKIDTSNCKKVFELQTQNVEFKKIKFKKNFYKVICLKIEDEWCAFSFKY